MEVTISADKLEKAVREAFCGDFRYAYQVPRRLDIDKVIYNDPATIVIWNDGTKTVVKCHEGDRYDPEKGFLLCCAKKLFGNTGRYNDVMREHAKPESFGEFMARAFADILMTGAGL